MANLLAGRVRSFCSAIQLSLKTLHQRGYTTRAIAGRADHGKLKPPKAVHRHRLADKQNDDPLWSVIAYNLSEELKIDKARMLLETLSSNYELGDLPADVQKEAVVLRSKRTEELNGQPDERGPLYGIFLFREGSVVFWGVPYEEQRRVLRSLASLKINPNANELIQGEKEHLNYDRSLDENKSRLAGDVIQIATRQDEQCQLLDQFAFSHAVALSVKLGIWEMILDEYINSVGWITENMRAGKSIKLTRDEVFRKTGEILSLKHSINLESDLLDLPDIYWDRNDQELLFSSLSANLNMRRRTNVINEKLNNCCDLMNLLSSHMNDRHHLRLEWMIIALITVEVIFEIVHFCSPRIKSTTNEGHISIK